MLLQCVEPVMAKAARWEREREGEGRGEETDRDREGLRC